jgi:hypothetical protein
VYENPVAWAFSSGEVDMTLPFERDPHSSSPPAPPLHHSDRLSWLRRHWPLASITAAVFIMLVWMGALMCFALIFARRI